MRDLGWLVASVGLLLFGAGEASALKTEWIDFGVEGAYDGLVYVGRDGSGSLVFCDSSQTTPVTLLELVAGLGASSHDALSGLGGDDHGLYLTAARHLSAHVAAFNSALSVSADVHGNTTLGGHLGDADVHLDRGADESISGMWSFDGGAEFGRLLAPSGTTSTLSGASEGDIFWDSDDDALLVFDGSQWATINRAHVGKSGYVALDWLSSDSDRGTSACIHYQAQVAASLDDLSAGVFVLDVATSESSTGFYFGEGRSVYSFPAEGLTSLDAGKRVFYELPLALEESAYRYALITAWDGSTSSTAALLVR